MTGILVNKRKKIYRLTLYWDENTRLNINKVNAPAKVTFDTLLLDDFELFLVDDESVLDPFDDDPLLLDPLLLDPFDLAGFSSVLFELDAEIVAKRAKNAKVFKVFIEGKG